MVLTSDRFVVGVVAISTRPSKVAFSKNGVRWTLYEMGVTSNGSRKSCLGSRVKGLFASVDSTKSVANRKLSNGNGIQKMRIIVCNLPRSYLTISMDNLKGEAC